jgi:hypothetical protein
MARWQIILISLNIFTTTYLTSIKFIEPDTFGEIPYLKGFALFTVGNRPYLAIGLGLFTAIFSSIIILLQPHKTRNEFRDSLMDGIFEQLLDNDKTKARITIFRDANWLKRVYYKVLDFFGLWKKNQKLKDILKYCWTAHYISIFKRWGTEHKSSKTHFYFNPETAKSCQGIAGQVRQREEVIVVALPSLADIDLNFVDENDAIIQDYMKIGYVNNFAVLKSMNRTAPFIYGNIISATGGKKKYVLIIDSWASESPFDDRNRELLSTYVKQISASFGK